MVSCMHFVRSGDFVDCFAIADLLQRHPHDLIHKAVGWLLREVGKRDRQALTAYLLPRYRQMPRTMLRYAIEHYAPDDRRAFLAGTR
jgi:3-methyladenine DNA glycosylase AlkD